MTSAAAAAKCSDPNRRSYAMTTPLADSPRSAIVWATPSAQRRTFSKVYSSAMRARQPSVPKTMSVGGRPLVVLTCVPPVRHSVR